MRIAVELDQCAKGYGAVHCDGCRDLIDGLDVGDAATMADADTLVADETGWDAPYHYAPCVKLPRAK